MTKKVKEGRIRNEIKGRSSLKAQLSILESQENPSYRNAPRTTRESPVLQDPAWIRLIMRSRSENLAHFFKELQKAGNTHQILPSIQSCVECWDSRQWVTKPTTEKTLAVWCDTSVEKLGHCSIV